MRDLNIRFVYLFLLLSFSGFLKSSSSVDRVETAGDVLQIALPMAALSSTYILDDKLGRHQFWKSYISSISLTYLLKYTVDKTRPNDDCCESFPSGHTSSAFMGASFIQTQYGYKWGIPALAAAIYVGWGHVVRASH